MCTPCAQTPPPRLPLDITPGHRGLAGNTASFSSAVRGARGGFHLRPTPSASEPPLSSPKLPPLASPPSRRRPELVAKLHTAQNHSVVKTGRKAPLVPPEQGGIKH